MFNPQRGHYTNARTLYNATKKLLNNKFYGVISKKQQEKLDNRYGDEDSDKKHKKKMKGTIFSQCELPNELFNANRLVKTKIKQTLGRVGYLMLRDGTIELKGENKPELSTQEIQDILLDFESNYNLKKFDKPDYFANYAFVEGLISSEEFRKKGM